MNLNNLVSGNIGLIHLIFSILALVLGTLVLLMTKGTKMHKKIGYFYAGSMLGVILTAFMIYRLYDKFGIFHWMALVSLVTLLAGMIPIVFRKPSNFMSLHFSFMYWSVIGLYGAFTAETMVRIPDVVIESGIPNAVFYKMTGIAVALTMGLGSYFFRRNFKKWERFE